MSRKGVSGSAIFQQTSWLRQYTKNLKFKVIKLCDFRMDLIKWQLNFVSCNFCCEIILLISNRTRAVRSFDFEITCTIFRLNCTPLSSITIINGSLASMALWLYSFTRLWLSGPTVLQLCGSLASTALLLYGSTAQLLYGSWALGLYGSIAVLLYTFMAL